MKERTIDKIKRRKYVRKRVYISVLSITIFIYILIIAILFFTNANPEQCIIAFMCTFVFLMVFSNFSPIFLIYAFEEIYDRKCSVALVDKIISGKKRVEVSLNDPDSYKDFFSYLSEKELLKFYASVNEENSVDIEVLFDNEYIFFENVSKEKFTLFYMLSEQ